MTAQVAVAAPEIVRTENDFRPNQKIAAYIRSPEHTRNLGFAAKAADRYHERDCDDQSVKIDLLKIFVIKPIVTPDDAARPTEGSWATKFKYQRCGATHVYNATTRIDPGQLPRTDATVPGHTLAYAESTLIENILLQTTSEAMSAYQNQMNMACNDFRNFRLEDTGEPFVQPNVTLPNGKKLAYILREEWRISVCKKSFVFSVILSDDSFKDHRNFEVMLR